MVVDSGETGVPTEIRVTSSTGAQKGEKLQRYSLIPPFPLKMLAEHYGRGAKKYADHNWRAGYKWSLSADALQRHFQAWLGGEDYDTCPPTGDGCQFVTSEGKPFEGVIPGVECYNHTGRHHLDGVMWHSFTLRQFAEEFPDFDDRYTKEEK